MRWHGLRLGACISCLRGGGTVHGAGAITVDPALIPRARQPIDRMLAFTAALHSGQPAGALVPHIGAA